MNIKTLRDNLTRQIQSSEDDLAALNPNNYRSTMFMDDEERVTREVTIKLMRINIRNLKAAMYDVDQYALTLAKDTSILS